MLTLNQIKYKLIEFFNSHAQIHTVFYGSENDFVALKDVIYPAVNIEYIQSNLADKTISHQFKVVIGDLVSSEDRITQDEIISDSLLIADDFFTWLWEIQDFIFTKSSSIQPFVDENPDRIAGIVFTITLGTIRPQNNCQTPLKNEL